MHNKAFHALMRYDVIPTIEPRFPIVCNNDHSQAGPYLLDTKGDMDGAAHDIHFRYVTNT